MVVGPKRPRAGDLMPRGSALYIMSKKYGEIAIKCDEWMNMTRACGRPFPSVGSFDKDILIEVGNEMFKVKKSHKKQGKYVSV